MASKMPNLTSNKLSASLHQYQIILFTNTFKYFNGSVNRKKDYRYHSF